MMPLLKVMSCKHLLLLPEVKALDSILTSDRLWLTAALMGDVPCIELPAAPLWLGGALHNMQISDAASNWEGLRPRPAMAHCNILTVKPRVAVLSASCPATPCRRWTWC